MNIRTAGEVALLVRDARVRQGISQEELAARVGVSRKWVSELEHGKGSVELALALRTLNALDITIDVTMRGPEGRSVGR
jgi:HTH-type transcriptional regulator/antitoxin HipB